MKTVIKLTDRSGDRPRHPATVSSGQNEQIAHAQRQHRELDARLNELKRRAYLTPTETREAAELKKRKLLAKDEIARLSRH